MVGSRSSAVLLMTRALEKFDPNQPRDSDGKFSKVGAIKNALTALAGDDASSIKENYGFAGFSGGRHIEWEVTDQDSGSFSFYFNPGDLGEDDEQITVNFDPQAVKALTDQLGVTLIAAEKPSFDPNDRASVLLHALLTANGVGAAHTNDDESYLDISATSSGGFVAEYGDGVNGTQQMDLSKEELAKLHAALLLTQFAQRPGLGLARESVHTLPSWLEMGPR